VPGAFKNKAIGVLATAVFVYFLITDPTGTAHTLKTVMHSVGAFLGALND
jgi:hypothetical protein